MFRLAAISCLTAALLAADLQSLSWLAGRWVSDENGTVSEESWSPPTGDTMVGTWRLVAGGKVRIFEMLVFKQEADGLVLLLRHFDPALNVRVTEKDGPLRFKHVPGNSKAWVFDGAESGKPVKLTYSTPSDDLLEVVLDKEGKKQTFRMRRAKH